MVDALQVVVDMNANMWAAVKHALQDLTEEEAHWRPLPQANTISVIVRHLRIEAEWHLHSLEHGEPMPTIAVPPSQEALAAVSDDFEENFKTLEQFCTRFLEILRTTTLSTLRERTATAYGKVSEREGGTYFLGYHHATHLAMHCGQIRAIRNLYCKTRGKPARFVPENPTYRS
ncbi:MAG: DinB family protein [Gemmatimonadetes bacterium]|nr:DinB family protein [Gemmatimonadota bacterium]